ncbi:MAG: molecular chaperone TorD family protein [Deltaproteobacteria bacterium]|nr:molecular chaperone TorD family protein [Deltaproteobacteria bacterium]
MSNTEEKQVLSEAYGVIGELFLSAPDVDLEALRAGARDLSARLVSVDDAGAASLSRFLEEPQISEEDYVDLFELEPKCPLYMGSHVFEEPKTCATASVSERNDYMIELLAIYRHFGRAPNGMELPDYLPMMVDFLATTASSGDPIRVKLLRNYLLPYLPPMRKKLLELGTPYLHLLDALENVIRRDLGKAASADLPDPKAGLLARPALSPSKGPALVTGIGVRRPDQAGPSEGMTHKEREAASWTATSTS